MNKRQLQGLAMAVAFLLPVGIAKLALEFGWFNTAATNKGQLLDPIVDFSALTDQILDPAWRIVYIVPNDCSNACENALYSLNQVWMALGRESNRVKAVALLTEQSESIGWDAYPKVSPIQIESSRLEQAIRASEQNDIFLVDTLNNMILRYPTFEQERDAVLHSRDILADIRKLLKLSRIG